MDRTLTRSLSSSSQKPMLSPCLYLGADLAMTQASCRPAATGIPGQVNTSRKMLTREEKVARIMAQQETAGLRESAKPVLKSRDAPGTGNTGLLQPMLSALTRIAQGAQVVVDALIPRFPGAGAAVAGAAEDMAPASLKLDPLDDGATVGNFTESAKVLGLQVQLSRDFLPGEPSRFPPTFDPDTTRLNGLPLFIDKAAGNNATLALIASYARQGDFIVTTDPHIGRDLACFELVEAAHCTVSGYCDERVQQGSSAHQNASARTFILLSLTEIESLMSVIGPGNRNATFDFVWAGTSPLPTPPFNSSLNCGPTPGPDNKIKELSEAAILFASSLTITGILCGCMYRLCKSPGPTQDQEEEIEERQRLLAAGMNALGRKWALDLQNAEAAASAGATAVPDQERQETLTDH